MLFHVAAYVHGLSLEVNHLCYLASSTVSRFETSTVNKPFIKSFALSDMLWYCGRLLSKFAFRIVASMSACSGALKAWIPPVSR